MISYTTAVVLILIGVAPLATSRRASPHFITFFLAMAAGMAISARPTWESLGPQWELPCRLLTNALQLVAVRELLCLARGARPPVRRTPWWPMVLCIAVMTACMIDVAPHHAELTTLALQWRPSVVLYQLALTAYPIGCLLIFVRTLSRSASERPRGTFRTGLRVIVAAAGATIAWGFFSGLPSLWLAVTDIPVAGFLPRSVAIGAVAMSLWVIGALLTTYDGAVKLVRTWRGIRAVTPLWRALVAAQPQIALPARHDLEFTLYRRLIEIRDGLLALRTHVPPHLTDWLRTPVDSPTLAAAELAAALVMREAGRTWPQPPSSGTADAPSVEAETAWLSAVSSAYTRSPVVREVRRQAVLSAAG